MRGLSDSHERIPHFLPDVLLAERAMHDLRTDLRVIALPTGCRFSREMAFLIHVLQ